MLHELFSILTLIIAYNYLAGHTGYSVQDIMSTSHVGGLKQFK